MADEQKQGIDSTVPNPDASQMAMRDCFAAIALHGAIFSGQYVRPELADHCYRFADEMLRARKKVSD